MKNIIILLFLISCCLTSIGRNLDVLCLKNDGARCKIDVHTGAPVWFQGELWSYKMVDGRSLNSTYFMNNGAVSHRFLSDSSLIFDYCDSVNRVSLRVSLGSIGLDYQLVLTNTQSDVCEVSIPASIDFSTEKLNHVIFPNELGVKLKRSFYTEQKISKIWKSKQVGSDPLMQTCGIMCVPEPNVNMQTLVHVSSLASRIFSDKIEDMWSESNRLVVRMSTVEPKYNFITSDIGSFFGGHVVGHGMLLRFGGKLVIKENDLVIETVKQTVTALGKGQIDGYDPKNRTKIGLLNIAGCPNSTGWSEIPVDSWYSVMNKLAEFENITSVQQAITMMQSDKTLVIINPYGELLPIGDKSLSDLLQQIKQYMTNGGLWVETGGYPFFNTLEPSRYNALQTQYPFAFSDIFEINSQPRSICFYGIQNENNFIPMQWRTWADSDGGHISRSWKTFIYKNKGGKTPVVRFVDRLDFRVCVADYSLANNFSKPLSSKMSVEALNTWRHAAIIKFSGRTINEQAAQIANLPNPSIVHIWDYVKGGFDKLYPEHLPPNQTKGTMADFKNIIKIAHDSGHLFMPYTNNTWWCDNPASEILKRVGKQALLWDINGHPVKEDYAGNYGWSISPWHGEVVTSGKELAEMFSSLGCDIIFEDQTGAREWVGFDFNPASPSPSSYHQGIINMSRDASAYRPLATEQGYDRLINAQSEFCGLTWMLVPFKSRPWWVSWWLKSYSDLFEQQTYEAYPLAQYVTNGNTFFTHHLGGPLVETSENLAWTLLLGYQIIIDMPTNRDITPQRWKWVGYLCDIQNRLACEYMGYPMRSFEYLQQGGNNGVIKSMFDNIEIVANLSDSSYKYKGSVIASKGFIATSKSWIAGYVNEFRGEKFDRPCYIMYNEKVKKLDKYEF